MYANAHKISHEKAKIAALQKLIDHYVYFDQFFTNKIFLSGKICSKCLLKLPNILFNELFDCFSCARQNVTDKW